VDDRPVSKHRPRPIVSARLVILIGPQWASDNWVVTWTTLPLDSGENGPLSHRMPRGIAGAAPRLLSVNFKEAAVASCHVKPSAGIVCKVQYQSM
jgi:hypothetical protein